MVLRQTTVGMKNDVRCLMPMLQHTRTGADSPAFVLVAGKAAFPVGPVLSPIGEFE